MNKAIRLFLLVVVLSVSFTSDIKTKTIKQLKKQVERFGMDSSLKTAVWGFALYDGITGEEIIAVNQDISLIPASTFKIVTTGAALSILGEDFKYETLLQYTGNIDENGILDGNIYILGSGDPTFGSPFMEDADSIYKIFDKWVNSIKDLGITKINGRIIADESVFDNELVPREWTWEDIGNYYGAGSSGLTINENQYTIFFEPDLTPGKPAKILKTEPPLPWVEFINNVTTAEPNTGDNVYILGSPFSNSRWLTGTVPAGVAKFGVRGSMPDPAFFCAQHFHDFLIDKEIIVAEKPTTSRLLQEKNQFKQFERQTIATHYSPPLSKIIERINTNSVNTYAENLLKTIAQEKQNVGTLKAGVLAVENFWLNKGIELQGLAMHDGSGMAQKNRITTRQLAEMLIILANSSDADIFFESLAIAGSTGTLSHLFHGKKSQDLLIAKSGFLSNVIAYAGYTKTKNNDFVTFVLIVNNYDGSIVSMRNKIIDLLDRISHLN